MRAAALLLRHLPSLLGLVLLSACGGGGEAPVPAPAATVQGCSEVAMHDSGHVVYLVMASSCPQDTQAHAVSLGLGTGGVPAAASAVQLSLQLGQESAAVEIPGIGVRRVGLFRSGQWRKFDNTDSWAARDGAGLLVLRGELYLLGGWTNGPVTNEVWKSTDLSSWQFLGNAPWPERHGAAWLVHDDRLWVIGGDLYTDVWSSPDGVQWIELNGNAPFGPRYTPNAAVLGNRIIVYAGQDWVPVEWCNERPDCAARGNRSVWSSVDGKTWTEIQPQVPWEGRALVHGSVVHNGQIYLIGGGLKVAPPNERYTETSAEFLDIWSSADGVSWTLRLPRFSFAARTHFSVLETPVGCFVSDGSVGTQNNLSNDLFFAPDCLDFRPVAKPDDLGTRHASSVAWFNGSVVILGGPDYGTAGTAVWQYFP